MSVVILIVLVMVGNKGGLRRMAKQRIYKDHALTSLEKKRRRTDKAASIDKELNAAFLGIDWKRRKRA